MRYQQKQKVELEQRRSEMISGGRVLAASDVNENGKMLPAIIGNGKVIIKCLLLHVRISFLCVRHRIGYTQFLIA